LALAGLGLAWGGVIGTGFAGEFVGFLVILTFLIDLLIPALQLPEALHQLALTSHLGQPMVGVWDWGGMLACIALAAGGLVPGALGAWLALDRPSLPPAAWAIGVVSGLLEATYFVTLTAAYRRGELSVVYPLARGTALVLAVLIGVVILGERLAPLAMAGI